MPKKHKSKLRPPKNDLTGQIFGHLLVCGMRRKPIEVEPSGVYYAECRCLLCGHEGQLVSPSVLKNGRVISCGCIRSKLCKLRGKNSCQFTGCEELSGREWGRIQLRCKRRNIGFNLSIEDAYKLYLDQGKRCALTDIPIYFPYSWREHGTASLDRLDCTKGYSLDNVQWTHKEVNIMRNVYSVARFKEICRLVTKKDGRACNYEAQRLWYVKYRSLQRKESEDAC